MTEAKSEATPFEVRAEDRDAVRVLTLRRPEKLNAFTADAYRRLTARLEEAAADEAVAVCVLTGAGRAFSSGVDLNEMRRPGGSSELGAQFDPLLRALAGFPKPLLAAVNGLAVGFGATLLLHCDIVVVDADAELRMPFVALGTAAEAGSSWLLPRRVGPQEAAWLVLSGTAFGADHAVKSGFAHAKAPAGRALEDTIGLAAQLARHRVAALVANKSLLRAGWAARVEEVWQQEKAVMASLAGQLGQFGWPEPA
jgi:enoyl-CoA hydratase/carnithine racemase